MKQRAEWKCERCGHPHDPANGFCLTVHHLDGNKWNLEWWNLAALCQRCHLRIQNKVDWWQDNLTGVHSRWMADHVIGYNLWASIHGKKVLKMELVRDLDYSNEWATG